MTYVLMNSAKNSRTISFCRIACNFFGTGEEPILELRVDLKQQPKPKDRKETQVHLPSSALQLKAELIGNPAAFPVYLLVPRIGEVAGRGGFQQGSQLSLGQGRCLEAEAKTQKEGVG